MKRNKTQSLAMGYYSYKHSHNQLIEELSLILGLPPTKRGRKRQILKAVQELVNKT